MGKGSVEVGKGYYNIDGVNKIIFNDTVKKDFEDIGGTKGFKNNVILTLDNSGESSFILQGVEVGSPTGYKATKALDKFVYLSNNKDMILGDSPKEGLNVLLDTSINCLSISKGYAYADETFGYLTIDPEEVIEKDFEQPVLSSNGTIGGSSFAVATDSALDGRFVAWKAFDGDSNTYWHSASGLPHWLEFYNPEELLIKNISFCNGPNSVAILPIGHFEIQYSNDNSNWTTVYEADNTVTTSATISCSANLSFNNVSAKYWRIWTDTSNPASPDGNYVQMNNIIIKAKILSIKNKTFNAQEIVVHPEDFEGDETKIGYLSLANPQGTTKPIATSMRNPTKDYTGSVATPVDLAKKITLSEDFSTIKSLEDI